MKRLSSKSQNGFLGHLLSGYGIGKIVKRLSLALIEMFALVVWFVFSLISRGVSFGFLRHLRFGMAKVRTHWAWVQTQVFRWLPFLSQGRFQFDFSGRFIWSFEASSIWYGKGANTLGLGANTGF
jgi:hypothetical protein